MFRHFLHFVLPLVLLFPPQLGTLPTSPQIQVPIVAWTVNTTEDHPDTQPGDGHCDGDALTAGDQCSLRAAVMEANAWLTDTDTIDLPAGTYALTLSGAGENGAATGDLDVLASMTIRGVSTATTVVTSNWVTDTDRLFHASGTLTTDVRFNRLTIMGGTAAGPGGGIYSVGNKLTLDSVALISNTASSDGGGLAVERGQASVSTSQVLSNAAGNSGGGLHLDQVSGLVQANGLVIQGNHATLGGGGMWTGITVTVNLGGSSVIANSAGGDGGGIYNGGHLTVLGNLALTANEALNGGGLANAGTINLFYGVTLRSNTALQNGGGLQNSGQMQNVYEDSFIQNAAGGEGGALHTSGTADLTQSLFYSNTAVYGGGVSSSGYLTVTNSTVSTNQALESGGGVMVDLGGSAELTSTTIVSNAVVAGDGGGLSVTVTSTASLHNTLLALNQDPGGEAPDCGGAVVSLGYNLIGTTVGCSLTATVGDLLDVGDPAIGPLQSNGGSTWTHALVAPVSPALDTGDPVICPIRDQRGFTRVQGGGCDIGAFELEMADLSLILLNQGPNPLYAGDLLTYTLAVTNAGQSTALTVTVADTLPPGSVFVRSAGTGWTCAAKGEAVTCGFGTGLARATATSLLAVVITAPASEPGGAPLITNTVVATSTVYDWSPADNSAQYTTTISPTADLGLTQMRGPEPAATGATLVFTVSVMNYGPSWVPSATVTQTLVDLIAPASLPAECQWVSPQLHCVLGALGSGQSAGYTVALTPTVVGVFTSTVEVEAAEYDPQWANNADTLTTTVNNGTRWYLPIILRWP